MMPQQRADGLQICSSQHVLMLRLSATAAVEFSRQDGHGSVSLRFGSAGIGPDVSVQPAAVIAVMDDHARLAGHDPNRWRIELLREVRTWHPELNWCALESHLLTTAIGAFTHPLLGEIYKQGAAPLDEIPRWASPVLRTTDAAAAAQQLTGAATNRRLTRSLAQSLAPNPDRVDLRPLGLGVAAAGLVSIDELANILEAATRPGPAAGFPSVDQIRSIRAGLACYPERRRAALLVDVGRHHSAIRLAAVMTRLRWVVDWAPRPLPVRLTDLVALCDRLVPVVAEPAAVTSLPQPSNASPVPQSAMPQSGPQVDSTPVPSAQPAPRPVTRQATRRPGQVPLNAPSAPPSAPRRWPVPAALQAISGYRHEGLDFCVPTSAAELELWSRQLHNCLDTYAAASAHQRSWLIGIRNDDRLIGCIEVCPGTRRLRQAQGPRNSALSANVYDIAIRVLSDHGLLRTHSTR